MSRTTGASTKAQKVSVFFCESVNHNPTYTHAEAQRADPDAAARRGTTTLPPSEQEVMVLGTPVSHWELSRANWRCCPPNIRVCWRRSSTSEIFNPLGCGCCSAPCRERTTHLPLCSRVPRSRLQLAVTSLSRGCLSAPLGCTLACEESWTCSPEMFQQRHEPVCPDSLHLNEVLFILRAQSARGNHLQLVVFDVFEWLSLAHGLQPCSRDRGHDGLCLPSHSWSKMLPSNLMNRVSPTLSEPLDTLLRSQGGPVSGVPLDICGHHRAACATVGVLRCRGLSLESIAVRLLGGRRPSLCECCVQDIDIAILDVIDNRNLAEGLVERSPIRCGHHNGESTEFEGSAYPRSATVDGAGLAERARQRKQRVQNWQGDSNAPVWSCWFKGRRWSEECPSHKSCCHTTETRSYPLGLPPLRA